MRSFTPRTSPLLRQDEVQSPSLGVRSEQTLLDYEPSMGSPATPVSDSILDQTTNEETEAGRDDEDGPETDYERGASGQSASGEGIYVPASMVETVLSVEATQQSGQPEGGETGGERKDSAGKKNVGG